MSTDPEPHSIALVFHGHGAVMDADTDRPKVSDLSEMQRWMTGILAQQSITMVGQTLHSSEPKSVALRGVSQIRTPPSLEVLYSLLRENVKPACGYVFLKLLIPLLGIERRKPGAERRQVFRCELTDSLFDVMHSTHKRVVFLRCNCLVLFLEHIR